MQIEKVYNNNVVQVLDDREREIIVMGKGLGFQKKVGDQVDESLIEKKFVLENQDLLGELSRVYTDLSEEELQLVLTVIQEAEQLLNQHFEMSLYIALADHLQYALMRVKEGLAMSNPLAWEIRKFYPQEFQAGKKAVERIKEQFQLEMGEAEAASIALHFVNAQKDSGLIEKNQQITKIIVDILEIVRLYYGGLHEEESVSYSRFRTHVQYFAQRVANGLVQGTNDAFLYEQVDANYPQAFACTQKIKDYVWLNYGFEMGLDEQVYLTIHIQRLGNAEKEKRTS